MQGELGVADARARPDVETALRHIANDRAPADVLICGSLYLAGVVLGLNREWPT